MYNNLYEIHRDTNLIDDNTIISIYIEGYNSGKQIKLARGNWYNDDALEHIHKRVYRNACYSEYEQNFDRTLPLLS